MNTENRSKIVYEHLTKDSRPPSLRLTLIITAVLTLAVFLFYIPTLLDMINGSPGLLDYYYYPTPSSRQDLDTARKIIVLSAFGISTILPLITLVASRRLMLRTVTEQQGQLLKLTNINNRDIVVGCAKAALYRLRLFIALTIACTPALIIGGLYISLRWSATVNNLCLDGCRWPLFMPEPDLRRVIFPLLTLFTIRAIGWLTIIFSMSVRGPFPVVERRWSIRRIVQVLFEILFVIGGLFLPVVWVTFSILLISIAYVDTPQRIFSKEVQDALFWTFFFVVPPYFISWFLIKRIHRQQTEPAA